MSYLSNITSIQSQLTTNLVSAGASGEKEDAKTIAGVMQNNAANAQKIELVNMVADLNSDSSSKSLTESLVSLQNNANAQAINEVLEAVETDTPAEEEAETVEESGGGIDLVV